MADPRTISFDGWLVRMDSGELSRNGLKRRLQDQPLQVLEELVAHAGEVVTREQLIRRLWPTGVVDFESGLNSAVRKLRAALDDEADTPRYIETVPRRGYRFIGTLTPVGRVAALPDEAPSSSPQEGVGTSAPASAPQLTPTRRRAVYIYICLGVLSGVAGAIAWYALAPEQGEAVRASRAVAPAPSHTLVIQPFTSIDAAPEVQILSETLTGLLRNRLAAVGGGLTVVAASSSTSSDSQLADPIELARRVRADFLLQGSAAKSEQALRIEVQLVEIPSGATVWRRTTTRPASELVGLREQIAGDIAARLGYSVQFAASNANDGSAIDLEAYELYTRGQQLMRNQRSAEAEEAAQLFRRATELDPHFARAYLALGQAEILIAALKAAPRAETFPKARKFVDRALQLEPNLGEAWIERARMESDPAQAEELFRKGLALAPNHGVGYMRYAELLFEENRNGEALAAMQRARRIDPLNPHLHIRAAFLLLAAHSDVAGHDRLLREALAINPQSSIALNQLATSQHLFHSEFATALEMMEQVIERDPEQVHPRGQAARMYLDIGDLDAARDILKGDEVHPVAMIELLQYMRKPQEAFEAARNIRDDYWWSSGEVFSPAAEAVRDHALATGEYAAAVQLLGSKYALSTQNRPPYFSRGLSIIYAHTLLLAGETERGRQLATTTLMQLNATSVGRPQGFFSRERAAIHLLLGEHARALEELSASINMRHLDRWWYIAELDPLFEPLRGDARFQSLWEEVRRRRDEQRKRLDELRAQGRIPRRGSPER